MADVEVMIPMSEYKILKDYEHKYRKTDDRLNNTQQHLWQIEQQLKTHQEEIQHSHLKLKELSLNAIKLAKKVMLSEELLANQEDRWLKREKDLLQKMVELTKAKEHLQVQVQIGKQIVKAKEMVLGQNKKLKEGAEMKYKQEMGSISTKMETMRRDYESKIERMQKDHELKSCASQARWQQQLEINQSKSSQNNQRLQSIIEQLKKEAISNDQKSKDKEDQFLAMRAKFKLKERSMCRQLQEMSQLLLEILSQQQTIREDLQQSRNQFSQWAQKCSTELIELVETQMQKKNQRIQELQQIYEEQRIARMKETQQLHQLKSLEKEELSRLIADLQKKLAKMEELKTENNKLAKNIEDIVKRKSQLEKELIEREQKLTHTQQQLEQKASSHYILQQQVINLTQEVHRLLAEIQTDASQKKHRESLQFKQMEQEFLSRQASLKNEQVKMNTQAFELAHTTIYGKKSKGSLLEYKEEVDRLWPPIREFLSQKGQILQEQGLGFEKLGILGEQLKLVLQRFVYLFESEWRGRQN